MYLSEIANRRDGLIVPDKSKLWERPEKSDLAVKKDGRLKMIDSSEFLLENLEHISTSHYMQFLTR